MILGTSIPKIGLRFRVWGLELRILHYRPPSQSGYVQTGYWYASCGHHNPTVAYCPTRRTNTPSCPRPYGGNLNNAKLSRRYKSLIIEVWGKKKKRWSKVFYLQ